MTNRSIVFGVFVAAFAFGSGCSPGAEGVSTEEAERSTARALDREASDEACGPDVIQLWAERDPEMRALRETSEAEFGSRWLERVRCLAELGDAESQLKLGIAYRDGSDGPPQDYSKAEVWFRKAAEQGDPMAQFNLAQFYERGHGVAQDVVRAHMWYNLAASGFDWGGQMRGMAFARRDRIESRLTREQVHEAQQLASEWWAKRDR